MHKTDFPSIPGYRMLEQIGQGAFATVYRAHSESALERSVAIKVPLVGGTKKVLESEVHIARRVAHPGLCALLAWDLAHVPPYVVMEYCPGGTVRQLLLARGRLHYMKVLEIVEQVLNCLVWTHCEGLVHGDLKPENLLVDADGNIRLVDFGLGEYTGDERSVLLSQGMHTRGACPVGTFDYMAPEQKRGQGDHRVDLYAVGVIIFELLVGHRPDRNDRLEYHEVRMPRGMHEFWSELYQKLCIHEAQRIASASDVLAMVRQLKAQF